MDPALAALKRDLRAQARSRLAAIAAQGATAASRAACVRLIALPEFARARTILLYLPIEHDGAASPEIDPRRAARAAHARAARICYPRMDWDASAIAPLAVTTPDPPVEVRRHGVPEPVSGSPVDPASLDFVVVPALAYDRACRRLGRGAGFYDRFLAKLPIRAAHPSPIPFLCGIAFDDQVVEALPADKHDVALHAVVTDRRLIRAPAPPP